MKKSIFLLGAGLLLSSLFFILPEKTVDADTIQVKSVTGPQTCSPGYTFQIKLLGRLPGGNDVQINPSENNITFDTSYAPYSELNYVQVNKDGFVTISPNMKGGIRVPIMIHLNTGGVTSYSVMVKVPVQLTDISDSYAENSINRMIQNRVISGYDDGTFRPHQIVTHEEFVTMLERAYQDLDKPILTPPENYSWPNYLDNQNQKTWYYVYVNNNQFVPPLINSDAGRAQEVFGIGKPISRQDAIHSIMQAFLSDKEYSVMHDPNSPVDWSTFQTFNDLNQNSKYYDDITAAKYLGIASGYDDGDFHPDYTLTREMAAKLIDKAIQQLADLDRSTKTIYGYNPN